MRKKTILISLIFALSLISCNNSKNEELIPNNVDQTKTISKVTSQNKLKYFNTTKLEHDNTTLSINHNILYNYNFNWKYNSTYSPITNPDVVIDFKNKFGYIWCIENINDKVYIYGSNENEEYRLCIFDNSLSQYTEILDDGNCYSELAIDTDGTLYTGLTNENNEHFLCKFSSDGELITKFQTDELCNYDWYIQDMHITDNQELLVSVNTLNNKCIYCFDKDLNLKSEIVNKEFSQIGKFSNFSKKSIIYDYNSESNTYSFYEIDTSTVTANYLDSISGIDCIINGTGDYNYFYIIDNDLYGYKISDSSSSTLICKNFKGDKIFNIGNEMYFINPENTSHITFLSTLLDTQKSTEIYTISSSNSTQYERILYNNKIQSLSYDNGIYTIHYIDTENKTADKIPLNTENAESISDIITTNEIIATSLYDFESGMTGMELFDHSGNLISTVEFEYDEFFNEMALTNDDKVLLFLKKDASENGYFSIIDTDSYLTQEIELDFSELNETIYRCFDGKDNHKFFFMTESGVYSVTDNDGVYSYNKILDFDLSELPKEITIYDFFYDTAESMYINTDNGFYHMTASDKIIPEEIPDKKALDIACINITPDEWVIDKFEELYPEYKINTIEFDEHSENFNTKWDSMMISDDTPDLLFFSNEYITNFDARRDNNKQAYIDLYDYLNKDDVLNNNDLTPSVLKALEHDGRLYQLTPNFSIKTILANPDLISNDKPWSVDEFTKFAEQNIDKLFWDNSRETVSSLILNPFPFYDTKKSQSSFDTDSFRNFISLLDKFSETPNFTNKFALLETSMFCFDEHNYASKVYFKGSDAINKGYPNVSGNGALIVPKEQFSIFTNSENPDMAWEFIKIFFTEEYQSEMIKSYPVSFPAQTDLLNNMMENTKFPYSDTNPYGANIIGYDFEGNEIECGIPSQESLDYIMEIINNAETLYLPNMNIENIFFEEYWQYESDGQDINTMSKNIQNRVNIYLNERY